MNENESGGNALGFATFIRLVIVVLAGLVGAYVGVMIASVAALAIDAVAGWSAIGFDERKVYGAAALLGGACGFFATAFSLEAAARRES